MREKMNARNSSIDLLKFIFSIIIVLLHFGVSHNVNLFPAGYVAVEGYFMITGYFMMNAVSKSQSKDIAKDTLKFILRKFSSFFLAFFASVIFSYNVYAFAFNFNFKTYLSNIVLMLSEIFPLQITGMKTLATTGVSWYLSAMMLALIILYPLARKTGNKFTHIICPIAVFMIYGALCFKYGGLSVICEWFFDLPIRAGLLRGVAGICAGCILYECVKKIKSLNFSRFGEIFLFFIEIFSAAALVLIMQILHYDGFDYFSLPFMFILLLCFFSRKSIFSKNFSFDFTEHFSKISFLLYLNHHYWNFVIQQKMAQYPISTKFIFYIAAIICSCIIVQAISIIIKRIWEKAKPCLKKQIIAE